VQLQREDALGMLEGQFLGDHAAHGGAADMSGPHAQLVHEPDHVVGHVGDGEASVRRVALARPTVVERDHVEFGGESGNLESPRGVIAAPAHDEHD